MNLAQRVILFLGLIAIIVLGLRPPFQWEHATHVISFQNVPHRVDVQTASIGHCWIWEPPKGWNESSGLRERKSHVAVVDWPRLGVYAGLTALVTLFAAFVIFTNRKP